MLLQRKRHFRIVIRSRWSVLWLFQVGHLVRNKWSVLSLDWTNGFHTGRECKIFCCCVAQIWTFHVAVWQKNSTKKRATRLFFFIQAIMVLFCDVVVDRCRRGFLKLPVYVRRTTVASLLSWCHCSKQLQSQIKQWLPINETSENRK